MNMIDAVLFTSVFVIIAILAALLWAEGGNR